MNMDAITLDDCMLIHEVYNQAIIINNGHITELINEPSRDLNTVYTLVSE